MLRQTFVFTQKSIMFLFDSIIKLKYYAFYINLFILKKNQIQNISIILSCQKT